MCKGRKENCVTSNTMPQLHLGDTLTDVMVALVTFPPVYECQSAIYSSTYPAWVREQVRVNSSVSWGEETPRSIHKAKNKGRIPSFQVST